MTQPPVPPDVLTFLAAHADGADACSDWPSASWEQICKAGILRWSIPTEHGGLGLSPIELLTGYEQLAGACLTTAFILSQREAAVRRLCGYPCEELQRRFLPALARGEIFATVGLSQLTTSHLHQGPALVATPLSADSWQLDGIVPWVTGADPADIILIGATQSDGRQLLFLLPRKQAGVTVEAPANLMALAGSRTAVMRCDRIVLGREWLLAGPVENVLGGGGRGVGGLETSCLALGLAGAAIEYLREESEKRRDLAEVAQRFEAARRPARGRLHAAAGGSLDNKGIVALRVECTQLVLRATQVALTVAKGAGFVAPHPAQRWARQGLFFLVWSCPRPAAEGIVAELTPTYEPEA